jgi:hypothetical protein
MVRLLPRPVEVLMATLLIGICVAPASLMAQTHVVSPAEVQKQVQASSQLREHNLDTVRQFVSSPQAERAIKSAHMNPERVKSGVSALNDQELADLAARAQRAQADFAAGSMGERDLLLILVAVAVLILIIVAVR